MELNKSELLALLVKKQSRIAAGMKIMISNMQLIMDNLIDSQNIIIKLWEK